MRGKSRNASSREARGESGGDEGCGGTGGFICNAAGFVASSSGAPREWSARWELRMRTVPAAVCLATVITGTLCVTCLAAGEEATQGNLFLKAAAAIRADSPAATSMEYPEAPPFGAEWDR